MGLLFSYPINRRKILLPDASCLDIQFCGVDSNQTFSLWLRRLASTWYVGGGRRIE